jgi:hypothetical protein
MDRIKVKQVEGALDTQSEQVVTGSKVFTAPQHFPGQGICMTLFAGYIYWCQEQGVLDQAGNTRVIAQEGLLLVEWFDGQQWMTR